MKKILKFIPLFVLLCVITRYSLIISLSVKGNTGNTKTNTEFNTDKKSNENAIRIINENLQADYKGFGGGNVNERSKIFESFIKSSDFDVCALQEMSINWYKKIKNYGKSIKIARRFSVSHLLIMTGIIYNSDTVKLIKSGDLKYSAGSVYLANHAVWGLFESKNTNKNFILISTHLNLVRKATKEKDLKEAGIQLKELTKLTKELHSEYNCPVIISGDFNSKENEEIYLTFSKSFNDCNILCNDENYKEKRKSTDHIFLLGNCEILYYKIIKNENTEKISDHFPVITDILL